MLILLSNDDGVHAPGLAALAKEFSKLGTVVIVAPEKERSTTGHSLTLHKPLRLHHLGKNLYSVSGGPADCIYIALNEVLPRKPDLVVSGINRGANLGQDVFYSGTVSAAREAVNLGIPAIATSLCLDLPRDHKDPKFSVAAKATSKAFISVLHSLNAGRKGDAKKLLKFWPLGMLLNVNVPNLPWGSLRGIKITTQGYRHYGTQTVRRSDARGRDYFWIGGKYQGYKKIEGSDCLAVDRGYVSVTPLELDTTMKDMFHFLANDSSP